jgi:hypothetical protein
LTLTACPPPQDPTPPRTVPTAQATVAQDVKSQSAEQPDAPPANLPAAPAPGEVVLHVRWKQPHATLSTLASYAGLPQSFLDGNMKQLLREVVREMLRGKVERDAFAELIDTAAPVDFVIAVDISTDRPKPFIGTSVGLTSLQKALSASKRKAKKLADGVWQLEGEEPWGNPCAVLAAVGRAPARVVCGDGTRDLTALGPYLARTLPTMDVPGGDIHAELKLRGLLDKFGGELATRAKGLPDLAAREKIGIPQFDDALIDAATAIGDEVGPLMRDLDHITADAKLDDAGFSLTAGLGFTGNTSWTVTQLLDGAQLASAAPDLFWRAPKSSATASYGFTADATRLEPVLKTARSMIEGLMTKENVATAPDRKALAALLRLVGSKHVAMSSASGFFDSPTTSGNAFVDLVNGAVGWHLIGVDDDSKAWVAYLNEAVKVYNRPSLQAWMKKEAGRDAKYLPTVKVVPAPASLGGGSLDVQISVANLEDPMANLGSASGTKPTTLTLTGHILVMADGKRSWIGFAADRDKLAQLMVNTKGQSPGADTITALPHLGAFRRDKHAGAAFLTLAGLFGVANSVKPLLAQAPASVTGPANKFLGVLSTLPNKGQSPITFATDVDDGSQPKSSFTLSIPKDALTDVGFIVSQVMAFAMKQRP